MTRLAPGRPASRSTAMQRWLLTLLLTAAAAQSGVSRAAEVDSLLTSAFGERPAKVYRLYSASDGRTYVEPIAVPLQDSPAGVKVLFQHDATEVSIGVTPAGTTSPYHYATRHNVLLILQGTLLVEFGETASFKMTPGTMIIADDWTGRGHRDTCLADAGRQCVILRATLGPIERRLPLPPPPAPAR